MLFKVQDEKLLFIVCRINVSMFKSGRLWVNVMYLFILLDAADEQRTMGDGQ